MKIQCDVCSKKAAVVFCAADEAALCSGCDHHVHHANKLAFRHPRLSLLEPPANCSEQAPHAPVCDICQERRAVLFCQQDRAVLCKDCDVPIHTSNDHTQNHSRYLLTRVKLSTSAPPLLFTDHLKPEDMIPKPAPISEAISSPMSSNMDGVNCDHWAGERGGGGGSSLGSGSLLRGVLTMEMLHGAWHFEDMVDSCSESVASFSFTKNDDGFTLSPDTELENHPMHPPFPESMRMRAPDAPAFELQYPTQLSLPLGTQAVPFKETSPNQKKGDGFTVPLVISPFCQDPTFL
ncbi:B-box zinc finger protein 20-like isoform X1 [Punica granatum]|uniref:B-box zinc finger protein 20-like isoform X1 n=1 Tax=Punica granatum TaxID=22663 RepID=A0A218X7J3_PUNGR|nr:B-box zinc finger protein 20-like isoform X1 [Punica granatum]OWM80893.1 hypothetical protein CDL15_Pgr006924 [Punica granatum]